MDEAVGAAEVDEDAEAADAGDLARADLALAQLGEEAVLLLGAPFLHGGALGQDDPVAAAVDLDDLEAQVAADEVGEAAAALAVGGGAHDLAQRDEGVDALDVDQQAALVEAGDAGLEDRAALVAVLEFPPALLAAGPVDGEQQLVLFDLRLQHVDEQGVADGQGAALLGRQGVHLAGGDDALRLGADVDDEAVAGAADERAFDDVATLQVREGRTGLIKQLGHGELGAGGGGGIGQGGV